MSFTRRNFLKTIGLSSVIAPTLANTLSSCSSSKSQAHSPFGIQLWTVKEDMAKDKMGTLKYLSDCGYQLVESFTGGEGPFWGMKAKDFEKVLADLGMKILSSHIDPKFTIDPTTEDAFKQLVNDAASIGMTHLINPYPGVQSGSEDWKKIATGLNRQGQICKDAGIKMGYHNHNQEFKPTPEGDVPYSVLLKETSAELVDFELDLYWAVWARQDPKKLFTDNSGRITFAHIKDLSQQERVQQIIDDPNEPRSEEWDVQASTVLGTGQIDFKDILAVGYKNGLQTLIVEQERFDNSTPLEDAKKDAEYMKTILT